MVLIVLFWTKFKKKQNNLIFIKHINTFQFFCSGYGATALSLLISKLILAMFHCHLWSEMTDGALKDRVTKFIALDWSSSRRAFWSAGQAEMEHGPKASRPLYVIRWVGAALFKLQYKQPLSPERHPTDWWCSSKVGETGNASSIWQAKTKTWSLVGHNFLKATNSNSVFNHKTNEWRLSKQLAAVRPKSIDTSTYMHRNTFSTFEDKPKGFRVQT